MSHKGGIKITWTYVYPGKPTKMVLESLDAAAMAHTAAAIKNGWVEGELFEVAEGKEYRGYWKSERNLRKLREARKPGKPRCKHCGARKPADGERGWVDSGHGTVSCGGPGCIVF